MVKVLARRRTVSRSKDPHDKNPADFSFPSSFRFERCKVLAPLPVGPLYILTAVSNDPPIAIWLFPHRRAETVECHVVTDSSWVHFSFVDNTGISTQPSPQFEWWFSQERMWVWDSENHGPPPSRPDHLVTRDYVPVANCFSPLNENGRRQILDLAHPILDWWPERYAPQGPIQPNLIRRRIDYGPLKRLIQN